MECSSPVRKVTSIAVGQSEDSLNRYLMRWLALELLPKAGSGQGHSVLLGKQLGSAVKPTDEKLVRRFQLLMLTLSFSFVGYMPCTILSRDPAPSQSASPPTAAHQNVPSLPNWHTGAKVH